MNVSPAQEHDITVVLALVGDLLRELGPEEEGWAEVDQDRLEADTLEGLHSGRFLALLARDESGAVLGVLTLTESFAVYAGGSYGIIDEMYVRPGHRGTGIGKALLAEAVSVARQRGWSRLDVTGPEAQSNGRALTFYRGAGFGPTGQKLRLTIGDRPAS